MATINLTLPKKVTITNTNVVPEGADANDYVVAFRYFRVNFVEKLQAGDEVVLTAGSSEEAAYYNALNDAEKGIQVELADANE